MAGAGGQDLELNNIFGSVVFHTTFYRNKISCTH
jgi:hypothetical protein